MLASLLPGLRDVRVPLTVGYLWFFVLWLWFSDNVPQQRPSGDGLVARAFDLGDLLGPASIVATASFCAYILGVVVQLPAGVPVPGRIQKLFWVESTGSRETRLEYQAFLAKLGSRVEEKAQGLAPRDYDEVSSDFAKAQAVAVDSLRPRLLVANQELYGEYDRLASEGTFRINVCPPLFTLGLTASLSLSWFWLPGTLVVIYALLTQGLRRRAQSVSVIQGAVLTGIIKHPAKSVLDRFGVGPDS